MKCGIIGIFNMAQIQIGPITMINEYVPCTLVSLQWCDLFSFRNSITMVRRNEMCVIKDLGQFPLVWP